VEEIVTLLAPHTCGLHSDANHHNIPSPRGDCRHVAGGVLEEVETRGSLSVTLGTPYVQRDQAVATPRDRSSVRFRRVDSAWRINEF
jgi:hypothetical protein